MGSLLTRSNLISALVGLVLVLIALRNLAVGALSLVLVLIALRVFGRIRLTFRFRGAVTVSPWAQQPCPHLGLLDEPFVHMDDPSEEHRCYLWMQRDRVDLAHQKGFCLSSAHTQCPWMSIAPPAGEAPLPRKLATATPAMVGSMWDYVSDELTSLLVWLVWKLNRGRIVARQWADKYVPLLVPLAIFVSRQVSTRAPVVGRAIAKGSGIAASAFLAWLRGRVTHAGKLAKASAKAAWTDRVGATPNATSPAETTPSVQIPDPEPSSPVGQPAVPPWAAAPVFMAAPAKEAGGHLQNLIEQGKKVGMSGNRRLAYTLFSLVVDLDPNNDDAWMWKGGMTDDTEEKIACFQKALAVNPNNQKAQQAFRQISQEPWGVQPGAQGVASTLGHRVGGLADEHGRIPGLAAGTLMSAEALTSAALMALEHGDEEGANRLFVKATEVSPESEKAWFWRAKTSATLNEVIYSLQQALAINPGNEKVRANLLWAIQRQQKEEQDAEAERQAAKEEVKAKKEEAKSRRRSPVAVGCRGLASLVCLAVAAYWILVALMPLAALPAMKQAFVDFQGIAEVDLTEAGLLYHNASQWLPELSWASFPGSDMLEMAPGYNLLAAVPYVVGFLHLFVALGLARREGWSRFWAVAATSASIALLLTAGARAPAAALAGGLGLVTILTLVLSRSEFRPEKRKEVWQPAPFSQMPATVGKAR